MIFEPCPNISKVKEKYSSNPTDSYSIMRSLDIKYNLGQAVFHQTKNDHRLASSIEDIIFMNIREHGQEKDASNSWVAPLHSNSPRCRLPDNRIQAAGRL